MKIMFASGSMQGGGAERVVSILANNFVARGFSVSILVVRGESVYTLDERVKLVPVYQEAEITAAVSNKIIRRLNYLPRLLAAIRKERPEVIVPVHGGGWNGGFVLMARLLGIRVVAAEHTSHSINSWNLLRWVERKLIYRLASAVTVLTQYDYDFYSQYLRRVVLLPNPLSFIPVAEVGLHTKVILAAGRLDSWSQKGFDNLLKVFAQLAPGHSDWRLQIAGSGAKGRQYLSQLASELGIAEKVDFLGFQPDIEKVMQQAAIFVLSSRFEGFGMVLIEAMSQGCACISFNCPAGPSDIIEHGVDGILIKDQDNTALGNEIQRLMADDELRKSLATAGLVKVEKFAPAVIVERWMGLFRSIGLLS